MQKRQKVHVKVFWKVCLWFCYDYDVAFLSVLFIHWFIFVHVLGKASSHSFWMLCWGSYLWDIYVLVLVVFSIISGAELQCTVILQVFISFHIVASFKHAELLLSCSACLIWDISNFNKTSLCFPSRNTIPCPWLVISWLAEDLPLFSSPGWAVLTFVFHGAPG